MIHIYIIIAFVLAALLSYFILPRIILISYKKKLFDEIDERKLHTSQIPRLGGAAFPLIVILTLLFVTGIAFLCGNGVGFSVSLPILLEFVFLLCGMMLLFMIGVADDLIGVNYRSKLLGQIVAACFFPLSGLYISSLGGLLNIYEIPPYLGMPMTVFLVVYITNAINLIDGLNGLASGIVSIALIVIGVFFLIQEMWLYAMLSFIVLGLLIPFFYYNVFKQKLFMGDTGSMTLGYMISFLMIHFCLEYPDTGVAADKSTIATVFSVMVVPCFDVIRVVLVRLRNKKSPFQPDRNHIHHKFLLVYHSPQKSMAAILCVALFFIGSNMLLDNYVSPHIMIIYDVVCWMGIHLWLNVRIQQSRTEMAVMTMKKKNCIGANESGEILMAKR